jgi:hypothetical protein
MTEAEVLDLVERTLEPHQPDSYRLNVIRSGVEHNGNWWYVTVLPDKPDVSAYDYGRIVAQAEDEIENQAHVKVLLLPTLPD